MQRLIVFLISVACIACSKVHAQKFIKLDQNKSLQKLAVFSETLHQNPVIQIADSTIHYFIHDSLQRHYDLHLHFDNSGKCDMETHIWDCDSCYQKELDRELNKSHLNWEKVSSITYVSKAKRYLMLEKNPIVPFSFTIRRTQLSFRQATDLLRYNKNNESAN